MADTIIDGKVYYQSSLQDISSIPVYEISDPEEQQAYATRNAVYVPRWVFLLQFAGGGSHFKALDLLAERMIRDSDRRLKEKNL